MSIDLGAILDGVQPLVEDAIVTIGTEATILVNRQHGTDEQVNDDLTTSDPTPDVPFATEVPALFVPDPGGAQQPVGPGVTVLADGYTVLLLPDQELPPGLLWIIRPDVSRDPAIIGVRFVVRRVAGGSAGAVRQLRCEPEPVQ